MLRRKSSVMWPPQPDFSMALSIASNLSHPCSGMTSGRYVAVNFFLDVTLGRFGVEEKGDGASDVESCVNVEGWGNVM